MAFNLSRKLNRVSLPPRLILVIVFFPLNKPIPPKYSIEVIPQNGLTLHIHYAMTNDINLI